MTTPRRSKRKSNKTVWIVLHCEYMRNPKHRFVDEMLFHIASTLKGAERFMRRSWVSPYSWWEIQRRFLDVDDDDVVPEKHFFNHQGKPRKSPPHDQALRAYKKWWADLPEKFKSGDPD